MALYNDSDSDSDTELFTNNARNRLTRNSNFELRPKMYEEEQDDELVYTKDTRKFNPYDIALDDNESVGSALSIPKRVRQSTNADEVDSDNDFEPYMRGRKLVIATDDDIDNFLDGNGSGEKEDIDGKLDGYGSASDMEEGVGSASEGEGAKKEVQIGKDKLAKLKEKYTAKEITEEQLNKYMPKKAMAKKEGAKEQVREVLAKVRSAKKSKSIPARAMVAPAIALKPAEEMLQEVPEAISNAKKFLVTEEAKPTLTSPTLQEKESDLKILLAKPTPADPKEAKALKTAITNLRKLITRMTGQLSIKPILFKSANIKEVEVGTGKGSKKVMFNDVEITPTKMTLATMRKALEEVKNYTPSKERTRVEGKINRAILDRIKRDKATEKPDEVVPAKVKPVTKKRLKIRLGGGGSSNK